MLRFWRGQEVSCARERDAADPNVLFCIYRSLCSRLLCRYRWTKDNPANLLAQHSISLKKITASELEKVPVEKLSLPVMTNAVDLQGPEEATLSLMYKICIKSFRTEGTEHTKLRNR